MDKESSDSKNAENCKASSPRRPSTLSLDSNGSKDALDSVSSGDSRLRVWQDSLNKRRDSDKIKSAIAEIKKTGEDLSRELSQQRGKSSTSSGPLSPRNSSTKGRLPQTQPAPVVAVTNTVLSPVMQESHPREMSCVLPERATSSRERRRSIIDPSQVKESRRVMNEPEVVTSPTVEKVPNCDVNNHRNNLANNGN